MPNNDPTFTLILGEICLVLTIAILMLLAGMLFRKRKQLKLLSAMLQRVTDNEEERKQVLVSSLSGISGVDGKMLEGIAQELVTQERLFYQLVTTAFMKNETTFFEHIDNDIHNLVSPYTILATSNKASTENERITDEEPAIPDFGDAIDDLLSDESHESQKDPEFDLSATEQEAGDEDDTISKVSDIAEIPEDLLNENPDATESAAKDN